MKKGETRKRELLQIAYRLFLSEGYENTSVDTIIKEAAIAKGTYYYYFASKEQMLEEVIGMMMEAETERAKQVLMSELDVPQKIMGIITSLRPSEDELSIEEALNKPENILMHKKMRQKLLETIVPLLSEAVTEGIQKGVFCCDRVPERVKLLLLLSSELFDKGNYTPDEADIFLEMTEKLLGAPSGAMGFLRQII